MNSLAIELNEILKDTAVGRMLSGFGKRIYFPHGIIAQSAEAKKSARTANGTIGMAYSGGKPMLLPALKRCLPDFEDEEIVAYAPTAGNEKVRELWKKLLLQKNPSLNPAHISLPVVTPGITASISYTAELFLDPGQTILSAYPAWDNYALIFEERVGAVMRGVSFFDSAGCLDIPKIREAVQEEARKGSVRVILNFPNNPAGYSPNETEARAIAQCLYEAAESGADVLAICDDAYFGFFYEDDIYKESIFSLLSGLHERVLAVKTDGPTKEDYNWGLRLAMVTIGSKGLQSRHFDALVTKFMGTIRSSVSCSNTLAQSMFLKTCADESTSAQKTVFFDIMKERYNEVKKIVRAHKYHPRLTPMPFNSGYFMSMRCNGIDAGRLRRELLEKYGIGVIAFGGEYIRVAFSAIEKELLPEVFTAIYEAALNIPSSS
ncbi:MAG: aminotransferase class I/II-fold pyridoxal phosphate-dependent enzyme [Spirochaetaceae bacterium]|jgi:aspartate/methionine/tyrosine aminotransferase|nr:aminotransferase class I/II-fold pyridoxal phosphate-dependent enzyme [Spirochaetaceae bacterium]